MAIIRDRMLIEDWNDIPVAIISNCISDHQKSISRLDNLENYYLGNHKILARTLSSPSLPNNKLLGNHAKYISDIAVGYLTGNAVKYDGNQIEAILEIYNWIDIDSHDAELAKDLSIFGIGRELHFMTDDDSPIPKVTVIDPRNIFLVVDDTVEYKSLFGVHYYPKRDISNAVVGYYVNAYTTKSIRNYFVKELASQDYELLEEKEHYFNGVPIVEFWNNEEQQGDFEQQISLIDAYNTLMSDRVNDKEQLVDAILAISGASLGDSLAEMSETAKFLKEHKMLELPEGATAQWLIKNLNESDVEVLRNAIRDDIHQFSMVPSLTDKKFAANVSGVAMKYKLFGLEQLAQIKERYFKQGLKERLKLFANVLKVKGKAVDVTDVKITMTRSLPANDIETAQMVSTLNQMVSQETLISQLSFVDNPLEEVKLVQEQKDKEMERSQKAFGLPMGEESEIDDEE